MFRFAILFDVKSANKFSAGFSQYPVSKVAATEMAQCVERQAASIAFGQFFKVFLRFLNVLFDKA